MEKADTSQDMGTTSKVPLSPQWQQAMKGKGPGKALWDYEEKPVELLMKQNDSCHTATASQHSQSSHRLWSWEIWLNGQLQN